VECNTKSYQALELQGIRKEERKKQRKEEEREPTTLDRRVVSDLLIFNLSVQLKNQLPKQIFEAP
jgi:hypothetical protein